MMAVFPNVDVLCLDGQSEGSLLVHGVRGRSFFHTTDEFAITIERFGIQHTTAVGLVRQKTRVNAV